MTEHRTVEKKPLVESLVELRWNASENENVFDEYRLGLGRFYDRIRERFPRHEKLVEFPREMYLLPQAPKAVVFDRFMPESPSKAMTYPLVQYGPGIATVNSDGEAYDWRNIHRPEILRIFRTVESVHAGLTGRLDAVHLRSIDLFPLSNPADVVGFLSGKLRIQFGSSVADMPELRDAATIPTFSCAWHVPPHQVTLRVVAAGGQALGRSGLLLDISSEASGETVRKLGFEATLDLQHKLIGDAFFGLLTEDLSREIGVKRHSH